MARARQVAETGKLPVALLDDRYDLPVNFDYRVIEDPDIRDNDANVSQEERDALNELGERLRARLQKMHPGYEFRGG